MGNARHATRGHTGAARPLFALALALALAWIAAPLAAYSIVLKDGSRIVAREKYTVQGDRAYFVLENGTRSFIKISEIDAERTQKANASGSYGTAVVLEDSSGRQVPAPTQTQERRPGIGDLIQGGKALPEMREAVRRQETVRDEPPAGRTRGGAFDLAALPAQSFANAEVGSQILQLFVQQELVNAAVFAGTAADRAYVRATADSEGAVMRAIATSAVALQTASQSKPGALAAIELLLTTTTGDRAGQFTMTLADARQIVNKEIDITNYYVRALQF